MCMPYRWKSATVLYNQWEEMMPLMFMQHSTHTAEYMFFLGHMGHRLEHKNFVSEGWNHTKHLLGEGGSQQDKNRNQANDTKQHAFEQSLSQWGNQNSICSKQRTYKAAKSTERNVESRTGYLRKQDQKLTLVSKVSRKRKKSKVISKS